MLAPGFPEFLSSHQPETAQKFKPSYLGSRFLHLRCGEVDSASSSVRWAGDPGLHSVSSREVCFNFLHTLVLPNENSLGVRNGHFCNTPAVGRQVRCPLSVRLLAVNSKGIFCQETEICLWIYTEDRPEITEQQPRWLLSLGKRAQSHGLTLQLQLVYCLLLQLSSYIFG